MKQITELQRKRAVNIIWNAARDYRFSPDYKAYTEDGKADLYWNSIIGAVHRHYEYPKLLELFAVFANYEDEEEYSALLWLGLENCSYQRELPERPVLKELRLDYARRYVARYGPAGLDDFRLCDCLTLAHYMRILGLTPRMSRYDLQLLNELEVSPELTTDEIVERTKALFSRWFQIYMEQHRREKHGLHISFNRRRVSKSARRMKKLGLGFAECPDLSQGVEPLGRKDYDELRTTMTAEELREFMTSKYGYPLYSRSQIAEIERQLCRDRHTDCHLHFTKGAPVAARIQNGFEALQREREQVQVVKNKRYYQADLARNRTAIAGLVSRIQNSVLLHLQPSPIKSNSGELNGGLVWRATKLDDGKVFLRDEQSNMGDLCVDILLDASTSQQKRQEIVSGQGYMIAEALTRCGIPCRVMSFCSMTGYTIVRVYRDYQETGANEKIFDYVSNGCNRDGLAIRAAHYLISQAPYEHRLLIILSDVKPNDIRKLPPNGEGERVPYDGEAGINDTAFEVRRARADGIAVICVFTGDDADLPAAKLVYGRDFARIQSMDRMADTVGILIQNQIRNL